MSADRERELMELTARFNRIAEELAATGRVKEAEVVFTWSASVCLELLRFAGSDAGDDLPVKAIDLR